MKKENGSVAGNIAGFQGPLGTPMIKRKRDASESFEDLVTQCEMNDVKLEAVRKRGQDWVVFDDETETQKGVFKDREAAWAKQKQLRQSKKNSAKQKSNKPKKAEKSQTAAKPHMAPKPKLAPKSKKEHLMHMFKESIKRVMSEGSAISYVFEQDPVSKSNVFWNQLLEQLPREVLLSDPTLKATFHEMAKAEVEVLGRAFNATRRVLADGDFDLEKQNVDQDAEGNLLLTTLVSVDGAAGIPLILKIENGKPLLILPPEIEAGLNMNPNEEIRKLKAFLAFVQEDQLDKMDDISKLIEKRDQHLQEILGKADEVLMSLDPLKMSFIRLLLKTKYRGK